MDNTRYGIEVRSAIEGKKLIGHAAVFNQVAQIRNQYERLADSAFDEALKTSDAVFLFNHDYSAVLGRQKSGTLRIGTDSTGLAFEADLPNTQLGNDIRELVSRGDLYQGSFGFIPGDVRQERASDGKLIETHVSIKRLMDLSLVTNPAYEGTDIRLRSMEIPVVDFAQRNRSRLIKIRAKVALSTAQEAINE
jgi:HK97 family phage prohead protease